MPKFNKRRGANRRNAAPPYRRKPGAGAGGGGGGSVRRASSRGKPATARGAAAPARAERPAARQMVAPPPVAVPVLAADVESEEEEEASALSQVLQLVAAADPPDDDDFSGDGGGQTSDEDSAAGGSDGDASSDATEDNADDGEDDAGSGDEDDVGNRADQGKDELSDVPATGDSDEDEDEGAMNEQVSEGEPDEIELQADMNAGSAFSRHFDATLAESAAEQLQQPSARWQQERLSWPTLGQLSVQYGPVSGAAAAGELVPAYSRPQPPGAGGASEHDTLPLRANIAARLTALCEEQGGLTPLQREVLALAGDYRDLYLPTRSADNQHQLMMVYCAHVLSHVLRSRARIVHHNSKLGRKEEVPDSYRDQGLTRPKVLILLPFRHSAYRVVTTMAALLRPPGADGHHDYQHVHRYKRFVEEFGPGDDDAAAAAAAAASHKPADFLETFAGNTDDAFRIGIQLTKKSMRLYADFYHSDVLVASPLGLRTVVGADGEADTDTDFLNSIEVLLLDQTDVFLMQNWDHVLHVLSRLHVQPRQARDTDLWRVRYWTLSGWQALYRQTLVLASVRAPPLEALVSRQCRNYAGRVLALPSPAAGSVQMVLPHLPQAFHRFSAGSVSAAADARFAYFTERLLPQLREPHMAQTLLLVPSYFDYVRLRNHCIRETVSFGQICEYTKDSRVSRARDMFFHGKRQLLLYTERFHFYRRYRIRGARHVVFYGLPTYAHLYPELCNLVAERGRGREAGVGGESTVTVLYCRHDRLQLQQVVGAARAAAMIDAEKTVHTLATGAAAAAAR